MEGRWKVCGRSVEGQWKVSERSVEGRGRKASGSSVPKTCLAALRLAQALGEAIPHKAELLGRLGRVAAGRRGPSALGPLAGAHVVHVEQYEHAVLAKHRHEPLELLDVCARSAEICGRSVEGRWKISGRSWKVSMPRGVAIGCTAAEERRELGYGAWLWSMAWEHGYGAWLWSSSLLDVTAFALELRGEVDVDAVVEARGVAAAQRRRDGVRGERDPDGIEPVHLQELGVRSQRTARPAANVARSRLEAKPRNALDEQTVGVGKLERVCPNTSAARPVLGGVWRRRWW